jgi:hypothetical protein
MRERGRNECSIQYDPCLKVAEENREFAKIHVKKVTKSRRDDWRRWPGGESSPLAAIKEN